MKDPKIEIIGVRVTVKEKNIIKKLCIEKGYKNISDCIRSILKKELGLN